MSISRFLAEASGAVVCSSPCGSSWGRWDPIYADKASDRIRQLGDFSFFSSFMSQPKYQLQTFRTGGACSSDISYYLNAHFIDFNVWSVAHTACGSNT